MLEYYGDVIAMRHFQQGAPAEAAQWASVPVINCGDGWGEPTQVLTDLYTIWKDKGRLDGLNVLCVGDMRMRTMHSLLYTMSRFDMEASLVHPQDMSLLPEFRAELDERNVHYREVESVEKCIADADVIYMEPVVQPDYTKSLDTPARARAHATRCPREPRTAWIEGEVERHRAAFAPPDGRVVPRCRCHAPRPLLVRGVQRRRHAHGAPRARARRSGIGDRCKRTCAAGHDRFQRMDEGRDRHAPRRSRSN